jgi:LysM repeat protein
MTPRTRSTTVITLVICCLALPVWGQEYLLYSPQTIASDQKTSSKDGILVKEVEIRRGDTLYDLSKKFSGRGMYYPQILLFNSIKNPNLIYPGAILKIPVTQKDARDSEYVEIKPTVSSSRPKSSENKKITTAHAKTIYSPEPPPSASQVTPLSTVSPRSVTPVAPTLEAAAGQKLFEAAVTAYRQEDYRSALTLLDRYLADNSGSPLAADANLYKAECYLKLSAQ